MTSALLQWTETAHDWQRRFSLSIGSVADQETVWRVISVNVRTKGDGLGGGRHRLKEADVQLHREGRPSHEIGQRTKHIVKG